MKYDTNLNNIKQRTTKSSSSQISTKGALIFMGIMFAIIIITLSIKDSPSNRYYDDNDFNLDGKVNEADIEIYMEHVIENQE